MMVSGGGVRGEAVRRVVGDMAKGISATSQFAFLSVLRDIQRTFHRDFWL
jgi:hypothetical protein